MKKIRILITVTILFLAIASFFNFGFAQEEYLTLAERTDWKESDTYFDIIEFYRKLADNFPQVQMKEMGPTDSGYPLHLVIYDPDMTFDPDSWRSDEKVIVFNNNGIHPGETEGMDVAMMFLRDILLGKIEIPENVVLAIIPVYNIGGHLNRSPHWRPTQNGPAEYGSRGNARCYNLNRDFIKSDTLNTQSFQEIFNWLKPHLFIDTHTSNGTDYQHVIPLIPTTYTLLGGQLGDYLLEEMLPDIFEIMGEKGYPPVPYVYTLPGKSVEEGLVQYPDTPMYSTGFAAIFNTIGFMPETLTFKPYEERVKSNYALFETFMEILEKDGERLVRMTEKDRESVKTQGIFGINYNQLDESKYKMINFLGYELDERISPLTGLSTPYYNHDKPYSKEIPWYYHYDPQMYIEKPQAYVVPKGWWNVIEILERNGVVMEKLEEDSTFEVTVYHITEFDTAKSPFEGHYRHSNVKLGKSTEQFNFKKGDYLVPMNQEANRFVIELLEPQAENSLFAWNWFDIIIAGTVRTSEEKAVEFLEQNPDIREELESLQKEDETFAQNMRAQLEWVTKRAGWDLHCTGGVGANRYPIYRIEE